MVRGLAAAVEMIEFAASHKEHEALVRIERGEPDKAEILRAQAEALREVALSINLRAQQADTGRYVPIGDPGPGWSKMVRRDTTTQIWLFARWWRDILMRLRAWRDRRRKWKEEQKRQQLGRRKISGEIRQKTPPPLPSIVTEENPWDREH